MHTSHKERVFLLLQKRRITPLSVTRLWERGLFNRNLDRKQRLIFFVHLEQAYGAGLSLLSATRFLAEEITGKWSTVIQNIGDQLEEGTCFSKAVGSHPELSDPVLLSLLQVGEETGLMENVLGHITTYLTKTETTHERLKAALRYHLVLLGVLILTMGVLLETLVPSMAELSETLHLETQGAVKFWQTMGLAFSKEKDIFEGTWLIGLWGGWILWQKFLPRSLLWQRLFLKIPFWGAITLHTAWGHFFEAWRLLILAGIPMANAFEKAVQGVSQPILKIFLQKSQKKLWEGQKMSSLFLRAPGIKAFTYQLLVMGEKTGRFGVVLQQVVRLQEGEALKLQENFLLFLQPFCLGFLGFVILWIAMGTILPLYENLPDISRGGL